MSNEKTLPSRKYFQVPLKHDEGDVRRFTRDGVLASKIKREDPRLYQELRDDAKALGLLAESRREQNIRLYAPKSTPPLTEIEQEALTAFSAEECRKYFPGTSGGNADNAANLKKESPEKYQLLKIASRVYGVLPKEGAVEVRDHRRARPQRQEPQSPTEATFPLAEKLALELGLEPGRPTTMKEFGMFCQNLALKKASQPASQQPPAQPPRTPAAPAQADAGAEN
jgi:hypothetical protein